MTAPTLSLAAYGARLRVRRALVWQPELAVYAVAVVAAGVLVVAAVLPGGSPGAALHHHGHVGEPATGPGAVTVWLGALGAWTLMVLAMMLPVVAPGAGRVARLSVWDRRHRSMTAFLVGYVGVWVACGIVLVTLLGPVGWSPAPPLAVAGALAVAAAWQVAPLRRVLMRRCAQLRLGAAHGVAADRDCTREGARTARGCVITCGPVMLAMAFGHGLLLMGALTVLLLTERARGPNPAERAGRPLEAWCLLALATAVGIQAVLAL